MYFKDKKEFIKFLRALDSEKSYIGGGAQGDCYRSGSNVYKVYKYWNLDDFSSLDRDYVLRFKSIKTKRFMFPKDTISVGEKTVGDITTFVDGELLYNIDPLSVPLTLLSKLVKPVIEDIKVLSSSGVRIYDVMYNIILGSKLSVIDTAEYGSLSKDAKWLLDQNMQAFNASIVDFLIDGYFTKLISENAVLREMYESNGRDVDLIAFILELKRYLSDIMGQEINKMVQAKKYIDDENSGGFERNPVLKSYQRVIARKGL